jgi:hypothetical protein
MKIGILTLPLRKNYGGIMQAYALQTVLQRMGHDVTVLNIKDEVRPLWSTISIKTFVRRIVKKLLFDHKAIIFREHFAQKSFENFTSLVCDFVNSNINRSDYNDLHEIKEGVFDAIVVGSDQIWRPYFFKTDWKAPMEDGFLKFTDKWSIKRIAYAVSFGVDTWLLNDAETEHCSALAKKFDGISVREKSAVALCKQHLSLDVPQVLDPTLLLNVSDYVALIKNANTPPSPGNLLAYILDENDTKSAFINHVASKKRLTPFFTNTSFPIRDKKNAAKLKMKSVEEWLRGFYDADFIITDSFHGCVFSIIFNKPFIALGNQARGMDRFYSLLSMFGLEDRLQLSEYTFKDGFDYSLPQFVQDRIAELKSKSLSYLSDLLS